MSFKANPRRVGRQGDILADDFTTGDEVTGPDTDVIAPEPMTRPPLQQPAPFAHCGKAAEPVAWPPKRLPKGFPLTVTRDGFVKTIKGKTRWICGPASAAHALKIYHRIAGELLAGNDRLLPRESEVRVDRSTMSVSYMLHRWIEGRYQDLRDSELGAKAYLDYRLSAQRIDDVLGDRKCVDVTPEYTRHLYSVIKRDYGDKIAARLLLRWREACTYAFENDICDAVRFGKQVVAKLLARDRTPVKMKWKLWTPGQVRLMLATAKWMIHNSRPAHRAANENFLAQMLLGLNGGYGTAELSALPRGGVDLANAVADFPRGKTGSDHRVPLWPETVEALRPVMAREATDPEGLVFRTRFGNTISRDISHFNSDGRLSRSSHSDPYLFRFNKMVKHLGIKMPREGPYKFKHLANTVANRCLDPDATFVLFGHSMGIKAHYVEVEFDRVRRVVEYTRQHLILTREAGPHGARSAIRALREWKKEDGSRMKRLYANGRLRRGSVAP